MAQSTLLRKGERPALCMVREMASSSPMNDIILLVARHDRNPLHSADGSLRMDDTSRKKASDNVSATGTGQAGKDMPM